MNNYRQPPMRGSMPCGASRPVPYSEPSRCGCQNTAAMNSCARPMQMMPDCSCDPRSDDMPGFTLAMAYIRWQPWCNLYDADQAISHGTLFRDLDMDFLGRRCG